MAQQQPLHELPAVVEVLADELELIRHRVEVALAGRSACTLLEHRAQGVQSVCNLREGSVQPGVCFGEIGRSNDAGEMDSTFAHVAGRAGHRGCRYRHAVVRNPVVDDSTLDPRGHVERGPRRPIHVSANGACVALVGIAAAPREKPNRWNDPAESLQGTLPRNTVIDAFGGVNVAGGGGPCSTVATGA